MEECEAYFKSAEIDPLGSLRKRLRKREEAIKERCILSYEESRALLAALEKKDACLSVWRLL
jgi:hypothetical protein